MPFKESSPGLEQDLGPGVKLPPPLPFALGFAAGVTLEQLWPLRARFAALPHSGFGGVTLMTLGAALVVTGMLTFRRHRTAIYPNRPARNLVTSGVYAYTRNPMYLGLSMAYLGGVLATGLWWPLLLLPLVLMLVVTLIIRREEEHLHERFPDEYGEYSARVRRWF
jgi:protein-S-isoprenylcysteine O-methyltransferase Ste14